MAGPVYIALGDSITLGETDLRYIPSFGDRSYVGDYADILVARNGVRPDVVNRVAFDSRPQAITTWPTAASEAN